MPHRDLAVLRRKGVLLPRTTELFRLADKGMPDVTINIPLGGMWVWGPDAEVLIGTDVLVGAGCRGQDIRRPFNPASAPAAARKLRPSGPPKHKEKIQ